MLWNEYHRILKPLEREGCIRLPIIPGECSHNAHMFYILLENLETRTRLIDYLKKEDVHPVFHYVPLHNAPKGVEVTGREIHLPVTEEYADRLLRLPMYYDLTATDVERIVGLICSFFK